MDKPVAHFIPVEPDIDYATLDYEQQIQHTQRVKARILHKLSTVAVDGTIPTDKDSVELILKVAESMDRTTLANKRNAVEEANGGTNAEILAALAHITTSNGNSNPLMSKTPIARTTEVEEISVESLGEFNHKEGEGYIGVINETVEAFSKRMEDVAAAERKQQEIELGLDKD